MAVDFHSHVLPGIDDGSGSVEESIAMLRMEGEQGITHVVATPHFYPRYDSPEQFLKRRREAELLLRQAMQQQTGLPEIIVGAEVHYFRGISESDALQELTIQGKRCILIEMPHAPWTEEMYMDLEAIRTKQGLIPVIAHVDRYIAPFRTYRIPERLEELPILVQANAEFFLNRNTAGMAMRMLKADRIHLLGSDCHNIGSRAPNLGKAVARISRKLGPEALERVRRYENAILGV